MGDFTICLPNGSIIAYLFLFVAQPDLGP